jgi:adenylate kinase
MKHRTERTVIIDSHAVTKEQYGYRITGFSVNQLTMQNQKKYWYYILAQTLLSTGY